MDRIKHLETKYGEGKCEWCGQNRILIEHHYPIGEREGGKEKVKICLDCHFRFHQAKTKHKEKEGFIYHLQDLYVIAYYSLIKKCEGDELRMYEYLKLYAINKHNAFPSINTISNDLRISRYTTMRVIKKMEKKGRLIVDRTDRYFRGNIYDITWYDLVNKPVEKQRNRVDKVVAESHIGSRETSPQTIRKKTIINDIIIDDERTINPAGLKKYQFLKAKSPVKSL